MTSILTQYLGLAQQSREEASLRLLIELGAQFVGATEGSLLVCDRERDDLVFAMTVGSEDAEETLQGQRVPLGKGIVGLAAETHEVQIGAPTFGTDQVTSGPSAVIAAPMLVGTEVVGVITAVRFDSDARFDAAHGTLFARIAAVAGVLVQQQRRLAMLTEGASQAPETSGGAPVGSLEREIVGLVERICARGEHAKGHLQQVLSGIDGLAKQ